MKSSIYMLLFCSFIGLSWEKCMNPKVAHQTYTTKNILLSVETVYIAEFSVQCDGDAGTLSLFAGVNDQLVPVAKAVDSDKYQVSWSVEHKKAVTGGIDVKIYDEEGYAAYRKAQRSGENGANVEPLTTIVINHKGAGREGLGVQTEFLSAVAALLIWWLANTAKNKILE